MKTVFLLVQMLFLQMYQTSVTRAIKTIQGVQAPPPPCSSRPAIGLALHQAQGAQQSRCTLSIDSEGKIESHGDLKPCSPQCHNAKELVDLLWDFLLRGSSRKTAIIFNLLHCYWESNVALLYEREREKNIHWIYLPLEWTRQISILKGIAFKSAVDFENNIIAWSHKELPIFGSSWARLSFSPNSNNSITASNNSITVREMELQWTGIHFP